MNLKTFCTFLAVMIVSCSALFADPLTLTGQVVSVSDKSIVLMSGKDQWTIARNDDTKVTTGKLEVGATITVNTVTTNAHKNE